MLLTVCCCRSHLKMKGIRGERQNGPHSGPEEPAARAVGIVRCGSGKKTVFYPRTLII